MQNLRILFARFCFVSGHMPLQVGLSKKRLLLLIQRNVLQVLIARNDADALSDHHILKNFFL